jgi:TP901 family phage tail tape measure protein
MKFIGDVALRITAADLTRDALSSVNKHIAAIRKINDAADRSFRAMSLSAQNAGIAMAATFGAYKIMRPGIGHAASLQKELIGVSTELTTAGKSARVLNDEMKQVRKNAYDIQAFSKGDMAGVVSVQKALIKAGAPVSAITGKTGAASAAMALSTYENMDPVEAAEALIKIGTPYQIAADQYMTLADDISRAASASTTGAREIAEAAKYAAPVMKELGYSSTDMLTLAAAMANVGVDASIAGTSLRRFFLEANKFEGLRGRNGANTTVGDLAKALRARYRGMNENERVEQTKKDFGVDALSVALAFLNTRAGSIEDIEVARREALPLMEKIKKQMEGLSIQWESFVGTNRSTLALLFEPALDPLTKVVTKVNELVAGIGKLAADHPAIPNAATGIGAALLAGGSAAALFYGAKALRSGGKFLRSIGGVRGLFGGVASAGIGIAEGKAVEAATGVTPVFVTNWPGGFGGIGETIAAAGGGYASRNLKKFGVVGLAAGLGYGAGTLLNNWSPMQALEDKITDWIAGMFSEKYRRSREAIAALNNKTVVNVHVSDGARVIADSSSDTGATTTTINTLRRGAY